MKKEIKERVKGIPNDYQVAFYEISKYLWQFAANDSGVENIQVDILDMFESGALEGKGVYDIVGHDIIGFCDELLGAIPEHTWIDRMKSAMNQHIDKKLQKERGGGK